MFSHVSLVAERMVASQLRGHLGSKSKSKYTNPSGWPIDVYLNIIAGIRVLTKN